MFYHCILGTIGSKRTAVFGGERVLVSVCTFKGAFKRKWLGNTNLIQALCLPDAEREGDWD